MNADTKPKNLAELERKPRIRKRTIRVLGFGSSKPKVSLIPGGRPYVWIGESEVTGGRAYATEDRPRQLRALSKLFADAADAAERRGR